MKKCSYCNKELLQGQELCNSFCKTQAQKYQRFFERWKTCFAVLSLVGMLLALAGAVMAFFDVPFAFCVLGGSLVLLGAALLLFPFAPPKLLEKHGIERSRQIIQVAGIITAVCGGVFLYLTF